MGMSGKVPCSTAAVSIDSSVLPIYFKELYHSSIISSVLFRERGPLGLSGPKAGSSCKAISFKLKMVSLCSCSATTQRLQALTASISVNLLRIRSSDKKAVLVSLCLLIDGPKSRI